METERPIVALRIYIHPNTIAWLQRNGVVIPDFIVTTKRIEGN